MTAAQTLPNLPDLTAEQAEHWIAAALAEARALRQHDEQLYPASNDPVAMRTAQELPAAPQRLRADRDGRAGHDFEHSVAGVRHVVFLRLHRDDDKRLLSLVAVADHTRPFDPR